MSESAPQNLKTHNRIDPLFHIVTFFALVMNLIVAIGYMVHHLGFYSAWLVLLSIVVFVPFFRLRIYPLRVQDRVIRLEERLRLQALAPAEWHSQIFRLSEDQLVGLRFAGDDEVVELAKQALEHNLNRKQIKERIRDWRADNWRV
jgi:Family of unknown function (DUF6526)